MIGLVECGNGNIQSVGNALTFLDTPWGYISKPQDFDKFSHVILPGVGSFSHVIGTLLKNELVQRIKDHATSGKPLLGICLGMQLLFEESFEYGLSPGLALIKGRVRSLSEESTKLLVPHVGWNTCDQKGDRSFTLDDSFYFTHSYYCECDDQSDIIGTTRYGKEFVTAVCKENIVGFQFHPEKSQKSGLKLLNEFVGMKC